MAGIKISALPALAATAPTDIYPTVQAGVTYKVSLAQMIESASSNNSVRLATTTALTATYSNGTAGVGAKLTNAGALAALTIDDVLTVVGNRILVKDQASAFQNGVYVVTTVGDAISVAWVMTRAEDYDEAAYIDQGDFFSAGAGTLNGKTQWLQVNDGPFVIGTTAINFESNLVAGAGLTKNNNSLALTIPVTVVRGGTGLTSTTINQLLYSSSNNVIAGLATSNSSALITSAGGVPSLSSVLPALTTSDPVTAQGLATKFYVDSVAQGRVFKDPCVAATTGSFSATYNNGTAGVGATLTGTVMAAFAPDGVTLAVGDRVLFKDQGSSFQRGIYTTTILGTGAVLPVFTRALDMDLAAEFKGATTFISGGTSQAGQIWTETATVVTIGTDAVTFVQTGDATGVTSVTFTGDGTVLSATPSAAVTSTGTLTAALSTHAANTVLAGPTSGGDASPTFRSLISIDTPFSAGVISVSVGGPASIQSSFHVTSVNWVATGQVDVTFSSAAPTQWAGGCNINASSAGIITCIPQSTTVNRYYIFNVAGVAADVNFQFAAMPT